MQTIGFITVFFRIFITARRKAAASAHSPTVPGEMLSTGVQDPAIRMLHEALNIRTWL